MDNARAFRSSANFLMAMAATGSIFYFGVNHFRPDLVDKLLNVERDASVAPVATASPKATSIHAPRSYSWKLGAAIEKLLDADREYLHERGLGASGGPRIKLSNLKVSSSDADAVSENRKGQTSVLTGMKGTGAAVPLARTRTFIPVNLQRPELPVRPPAPMRRTSALQAGAQEPEARARHDTAGPRPAAATRPATGFAVVEPRSPPGQPEASGGFAEVRESQAGNPVTSKPAAPRPAPRPAAPPPRFLEEDSETMEHMLQTAARDIRVLPQADAMLDAFNARYPRDIRTADFTKRLANLRADRIEALAERARIGELTVLHEVPFGAEVTEAMGQCLAGVRDLERVAIAVREVKFQPQFPAYMVSLRFRETVPIEPRRNSAAPPQDEQAEAAIRATKQAMAAERLEHTAPCLIPLFNRGTVAVFLAGEESDSLPVARLEVIPAAIVFSATSTAPAAPASQN